MGWDLYSPFDQWSFETGFAIKSFGKAKQFVNRLNAGEGKLTEFGDDPDRRNCVFKSGQKPRNEVWRKDRHKDEKEPQWVWFCRRHVIIRFYY